MRYLASPLNPRTNNTDDSDQSLFTPGMVAVRLSQCHDHRPDLHRLRPTRFDRYEIPTRHGPVSHQIPVQRLANFPLRLHDHRSGILGLP